MSRTILITGPIGSGKSAASSYLAAKGFPVYDTDSRTKALYHRVPGLIGRIEEKLGLEFSQLRQIFSDEEKRQMLEDMVYPILLEDIKEWRTAQSAGTVFIESAVMLEKSIFDGLYDEVWLVDAPLAVREKRNKEASKRNSLQHFRENDERITRRIINDSGLDDLYKQLDI